MFFDCSNIVNIELSSFDTKNVHHMEDMFFNCKSLTNINLSSFDIENAMIGYFFHGCIKLKNSPYFYYNKNDIKILHQLTKI